MLLNEFVFLWKYFLLESNEILLPLSFRHFNLPGESQHYPSAFKGIFWGVSRIHIYYPGEFKGTF